MNIITGNKIGTRVNVFINGTLHSKECGVEEIANEFFLSIIDAKKDPTEDKVHKLYEYLNKNIRLAKAGGFEYDFESNETYLKGFNTPVPEEIFKTVEEYVDNDYPIESITNFWKLLMGNPDKRIRADLFKFIQKHDFSITDKGYMIVYKTVDYLRKVQEDLASFVSGEYIKIKDKWKESPSNYVVYKEFTTTKEWVDEEEGYYDLDGFDSEDEYYEEYGTYPEWVDGEEGYERDIRTFEYKTTKVSTFDKWMVEGGKDIQYVNNVKSLMETLGEIEEENTSIFTDKYTHTMKIKLGVPVKMERTECDGDPYQECSYGLHVGATKYVERFRSFHRHNSNEKESPVLVCLVNPMHVVAVPNYDNSKIRVSEYYPFARGTVNNGKIQIIESPYFEDDYTVHEQEELAKLIREDDDNLRSTAMNAEEDSRDLDEYLKVLESRVIDLSTE